MNTRNGRSLEAKKQITFGTLPSAFHYFNRLPDDFLSLIKHAKTEKTISLDYCDPVVANEVELCIARTAP